MVSFYEAQRRVNVALDNKFRDLLTGSAKKVSVKELVLTLTSENPISSKYVTERIELLIENNPKIVNKNGVLILDE